MKRAFAWLPIGGMIAFLALYLYSASVYSGGTRLDPSSPGYSHLRNYWCDLLDASSYARRPNPARPFALAATIALPLTLVPFWYFVPILFARRAFTWRIVRGAGCTAVFVAALMPIAHDVVINIAGPLVFVAFTITVVELFRNRRFVLGGLATLAVACSATNYVMWVTGSGLHVMPAVQKLAFLCTFIWIGCSVRAYANELER